MFFSLKNPSMRPNKPVALAEYKILKWTYGANIFEFIKLYPICLLFEISPLSAQKQAELRNPLMLIPTMDISAQS